MGLLNMHMMTLDDNKGAQVVYRYIHTRQYEAWLVRN